MSATFEDDFHCFSFGLGMWSKVPVQGDSPKIFSHSMAALNGNIYLYGGVKSSTGKCTGELHTS